MTRITHVVVAIPARDEERLLPACLRSVSTAVAALGERSPGVAVVVVVALDGCRDRSAAIAQAAPDVASVELASLGVGPARDAAIEHGLSLLGLPEESATWIACTDGDSQVPKTWLSRQVRLADRGHDLVLGTVEPYGPGRADRIGGWLARHDLREGHPHVHGANLGVRASAWRAVGGFGPLRLGEDEGLAEALRQAGHRWVATDTVRVRTSARLEGRASGGFAAYLSALATEAP